ncbi:hypothetical protein ACWGCW_14170 [Streptomyces sp. NPDC054933]
MGKLKKAAVLAVCAGALVSGAGIVSAGTAYADTGSSCSDVLPAHTNGNPANDIPQQTNATLGGLLDTAKCTTHQANEGLNGADDTSADG